MKIVHHSTLTYKIVPFSESTSIFCLTEFSKLYAIKSVRSQNHVNERGKTRESTNQEGKSSMADITDRVFEFSDDPCGFLISAQCFSQDHFLFCSCLNLSN